MDCKTCDELLAAYKDAVSLFKDSVRGIPGTGADSRLATAKADRLRLKCTETNDALMEHWREHHRSGAISGSREK